MASNSLEVAGIDAGYGAVRVLEDVSLSVPAGETVVLLGTNGNGKTTLMRSIMGQVRPSAGSIRATIEGVTHDLIGRAPEEIVELGIALVPEGRRLFPRLTVEQNLRLGAYRQAARAMLPQNLALCYELFPRLAERRAQLVGSMSGGEQQMVALGRALMSAPHILLVDEPSVGLAPILVSRTMEMIAEMKARLGLTVLMAEQNFHQAVRIADRGYVIAHGRMAFEGGSPAALQDNELVRRVYLGL
ncbi:ABC transporter ATP-binding protein [Siccirubricoccus deserti]|uniref:ABC transporter ATP-binding protein n=1 Tax=Siccirubricoccus deserti TaxID=2013562 RepID=A0A9X0QUN7_9PROT|nr:ABC transporter ATP-binding protein [Siccirubricoccus deserti]MBC4014121.1 ABC transporter ATP-binding protein [Siccirubricoccus deserti]GGC26630.1 ABC transporter ATP-binding protein [Siccirubricoccus deserti]